MRSTSHSDFRKNLSAWLDQVAHDHAPLLITGNRGKPGVVLMSLEDFSSCEETRYLLSNPRNAERLLKAVRDMDGGETTTNGALSTR